MQNLLGKQMYRVCSLNRACCSGRLLSLIESNELQGVSWDPSQLLSDGIWLITLPTSCTITVTMYSPIFTAREAAAWWVLLFALGRAFATGGTVSEPRF